MPTYSRKRSIFGALLLALVMFSGCNSSATHNSKPTSVVTPTSTANAWQLCTASNCPPISSIPGVRPFPNTWDNIHLFQTFTFSLDDPTIKRIAGAYDFVWGAQPETVAAFRAANPNILLSYYMPMNRDHGTFTNNELGREHNFAYWKAFHPDWILYRCDRVTPVMQFKDPNISLDFSNPDVINWQLQIYAIPASKAGYDALGVDNLNLDNMFGACGFYRNGQWVQRYSGQPHDTQYHLDLLNWLTQMQKALHALPHPMALIPNLGYGAIAPSPNAPYIQELIQHTDGILDEGAFTFYGQNYITDSSWVKLVQFIKAVQQQNKPYYILDEFPRPAIHNDQLAWALSSYLMCKDQLSAIFLATWQEYGTDNRLPQYTIHIGSPKGDMYWSQGVYWRDYSGGVVIVNPSSNFSYTIMLNSPGYVDLFGHPVAQTLTLPAHSGIVLLSAQ